MGVCLWGCNKQMKYGGVEENGHGAVEKISEYYDLLYNMNLLERESLFTDNYVQRNVNTTYQDISLVQLVSCEVLDEDEMREQDREWMREHANEFYSCCFVRVFDIIFCEEEGVYGAKGDEAYRELYYILVMENKNSDWKIEDYGYPANDTLKQVFYQMQGETQLVDGEVRKFVTVEKSAYTIWDGKDYIQEVKMAIPVSYVYNEETEKVVRMERVYEPTMFLIGTSLKKVTCDYGEYAAETKESSDIWIYTNCSWSYTDTKNQVIEGHDIDSVSNGFGRTKISTKPIRVETEIQLSDLESK